jgi:hypothetical protein
VKTVKQCKACPWRVGSTPDRDIPGYQRELHEQLEQTMQNGVESLDSHVLMACHHSPVGAEHACAGWLHNQLNQGNNFGVRVAVMTGQLPAPEVFGEQHESFRDTTRN